MCANNVPPAPQAGQQQAVALSDEMITLLVQRIIQMTQTFGCKRLTNGNGSNFWDQFLVTALMIASCNRVCLHKILYQIEIMTDIVLFKCSRLQYNLKCNNTSFIELKFSMSFVFRLKLTDQHVPKIGSNFPSSWAEPKLDPTLLHVFHACS